MTFLAFTGILLTVLLSAGFSSTVKPKTRPNIVLILADDLGWDDVSFHGSDQVLTPNIDLLAYTGVALERYYTHCVCTPSRAALLTGKYGHTTGMQGYPLSNFEDRGLPLSQKLLPEYLKELGYATHLVGKWNLGLSRNEYLPTYRGFDSHFGYRGPGVDYYEYTFADTWGTNGRVSGFDFYRNMTPAWDVEGYMTDVLTDEGKNTMTKKLDDSVGEIVTTLLKHGFLDNTIIVFISDNGGMSIGVKKNYASNYPLRGLKLTAYEGGIRVPGLIWSPQIASSSHLWKGYMHVVDWLPTLLSAIGADTPTDIDGLDLWNNILSNTTSTRNEMFEIFTYGDGSFSSIIDGDFKLVTGNIEKEYSEFLGGKGDERDIINGPSYVKTIKNSDMYSVLKKLGTPFKINGISLRDDMRLICNQIVNGTKCYAGQDNSCLFNIKDDPCETKDLSKLYPEVAERLTAKLEAEMRRVVDRPAPFVQDARARPSLHNYTWTTFANDV
ncbi:sulfatase domain-containing protein [Phthorimaea operculella]|nr:sulfatase domain-containing protein [Phthorimaea operculella]